MVNNKYVGEISKLRLKNTFGLGVRHQKYFFQQFGRRQTFFYYFGSFWALGAQKRMKCSFLTNVFDLMFYQH